MENLTSRDNIEKAYKELNNILDGITDIIATVDEQERAYKEIKKISFYVDRVLIFKN